MGYDQGLSLADLIALRGDNSDPGVAFNAPQNYIRNERTGAVTDLGMSQPAGPALDYSIPIEYGGMGKGYRLKGDATRAFINGQMVDLGRDTGAERARMKEDLAMSKARQEIDNSGVENQIKRAQLAQLMGAQPEKPLTEFQGKSSAFGVRAAAAHEQLNALEGGGLGGEFDAFPGYRNGPVQPGAIKRSAEAFPLIGESMGTALNFTQSAAQQRVDQAQRNFVNATLRQESGAAISQGEWDNAKKQYFPQPGDDASVIEQKRLNRLQVIGGFKTSAGKDGAAPIAPAQTSMRESLQQEMQARAEAIAVIKANPAARAEVIKRMQAAKYSTKGL